jgi:phasin family protein
MATATAPEKIQTMFTDMSDRAKTAFEKSTKLSEEFADLTKGNLDALAESAKIAAKNAEALAQEAADYSKKSFETATAALKRYSAVKSPAELLQLNGEYAKTSFDSAVAEVSKVSETITKMLGDVFQPLSSRYAVASEKIKAAASF